MTRLAAMEKRIDALERQLKSIAGDPRDRTNWLDRVVGSMADFPDFKKVVEYGRQFRRNYDRIVAQEKRKASKKASKAKR